MLDGLWKNHKEYPDDIAKAVAVIETNLPDNKQRDEAKRFTSLNDTFEMVNNEMTAENLKVNYPRQDFESYWSPENQNPLLPDRLVSDVKTIAQTLPPLERNRMAQVIFDGIISGTKDPNGNSKWLIDDGKGKTPRPITLQDVAENIDGLTDLNGPTAAAAESNLKLWIGGSIDIKLKQSYKSGPGAAWNMTTQWVQQNLTVIMTRLTGNKEIADEKARNADFTTIVDTYYSRFSKLQVKDDNGKIIPLPRADVENVLKILRDGRGDVEGAKAVLGEWLKAIKPPQIRLNILPTTRQLPRNQGL